MLWVNQSSPSPHDKPSRTDSPLVVMLLGFVTSLVRRQLPIFLVIVSCAVSIGLVFLLTTPARYTATATMVLEPSKARAFEHQQQPIIFDPLDNATVDTQVDVLTSDNVARAVIKALNLTEDPEFVGPDTGPFSTVLNLLAPLFSSDKPKADLPEQRALDRFADQLWVKRRTRTRTIEISFRSLDPDKAARIANAVVDAYISDQLEAKYQSTRRATAWLLDRINTLRDQASADMKALVEFKQKNNIVSSDGKLINDQQMSEVNSQLILAHAATAEAKARVDLIQKIMAEDNPSTATATADALKSEVIIKIRQQYLDLAGREAIWTKKYGQNHLAVVALRNQMLELKRSILDEMGKIAQSYQNDYEVALTREQSLEKSLSAAVTESIMTERAQVQLRELESNAQTSRTMYDNFLQKYMEAVQQQSFPVSDARLISAAVPPERKSDPKTLVVLGITSMGGLMVAFAVAALRELSDRVFRTGAKIEEVLGVTCITLLPVLKNVTPDADDKRDGDATARRNMLYQVVRSPFSRFTESLRSLKVIVDLNSFGKTKKVLGISSSLPNEGKSTIAANFSALTAHSGARVILIDADLRNPSLSESLGPEDAIGLVDIVAGNATLDEAIWTDPVSGLTFLAAGSHSTKLSHPNDFLGSPPLKALIDKLRDSYDYVVIDLPPLAPVVDTRMTTGYIDSYVYVVEWGRTTVDVVQHSLSNAREIYDRLLGVVLNKVDIAMLEHYEKHRTDYYYRQYPSYKHVE